MVFIGTMLQSLQSKIGKIYIFPFITLYFFPFWDNMRRLP